MKTASTNAMSTNAHLTKEGSRLIAPQRSALTLPAEKKHKQKDEDGGNIMSSLFCCCFSRSKSDKSHNKKKTIPLSNDTNNSEGFHTIPEDS